MKQTISIFMIILFANFSQAQTNNYESLWKEIAQLEKEGLTKSALKAVEAISIQAKAAKNSPQIVKALLYKSKYALTLEEDAQLKIINDFKTEISESVSPTKNLLENMLANLYWQYFDQNRYQFYSRTKTEEKVDATDFRTWDLQTLFAEIHTHYQVSLENGLLLQQTNLDNYEALLQEQENSKIFRPTLFDLLNHNALQFYKTDENSITKPAYKFEINKDEYLSEAAAFSRLKITSKDSTSLQLHALKIYQDLIQFHSKDKTPDALADVNLERLKFIKQHATFNNKDAIYLNALQAESNRLKGNAASGLYDYEIATLFVQQAGDYQPETKEENRWKNKEALELCDAVLQQFPKSIASKKCAVLKQQIVQQTLQITTESYLSIQKDARFLIRYKNLEDLSFVVYKISENQFEKLNKTYRKEEQLALINKLDPVTKWQSALRNEQDYQTHTTEVILPKLDNGRYVIFATPNNDTNTFGYATIQSTNLAVVENALNNKTTFQVIDRNNGKPIPEAKLKITYLKNNDRTLQTENAVTNNKGEATISKNSDRYRSVKIEVTHKDDTAYFGDYYIYRNNYNDNQNKLRYNGFLFTDRSIYRPGQAVFFKGIAIKTNNDVSEVFPDAKLHVRLTDANGQEVKSLDFVTNAFGSFQGEFMLPNTGLTGDFNISISSEKIQINGNTNISVEEYKRPKFEAKFLPVTETYKVHDEVTIKGNALAYAGSNITDAKVVYRVHRKVKYPRWYYWYRPFFVSEPQEITHGESITDASGNFEIKFEAQPDQSVDKKSLPVFHYEVTADITDLNGETRSASTTVNVGYHALLANLSIADKLDKNNKNHTLKIDTKNLNGEFAPAKGNIKIYKLEAPKQVLRPRPWMAPDYQELSENDFRTKFPHEAYKDEQDTNTWKKEKLVLDEKFDTSKKKELALGNLKKWESGAYVILLESVDKFGQEVKDEIKTMLFSAKDETLADNQLFRITTNKDTYKAGETALVTVASAAKDLYVTVTVEKQHQIIKQEIIHLNNNTKSISIPVTKEDVGGFVVHYSFSAFNSYQSASINIVVPYAKTELEIETVTFRDKLQPGTDETWSFKIKGPKGEKVSAELLASMYDASLNQFKPHSWNFNPITQHNYYTRNRVNARQSFGTSGFRVHNQNGTISYYSTQNYDQLNWFGFYFGHRKYELENMMMVKRSASQKQRVAGAPVANMNMLEEELDEEVSIVADTLSGKAAGIDSTNNTETNKEASELSGVTIRKNLQETAFFFPQLQTDKAGNISFSFTTPEALTKWNLQLLAHTKNLESTVTSLETVTQKELMVIPNAPRFLREGDEIVISSKIANLTEKSISGEAVLQLFDATTGERMDKKLFTEAEIPSPNYTGNYAGAYGTRQFTVDANGNTQVSWLLYIPEDIQAVQYKVIAQSENFSDGEQNVLPVLTNRMLVTETLPMWIKSNETKTFTLDKLKNNNSATLKNHNLALEMTSNPAWYAVQALPYLMEYPYDCNEQTFSRYYANALASHIANSNPRIQEVFNQWKNTDALLSNLEKNQELKSLLIQETPWLRDAQSETEQKKRIALLFDLNKMNNELATAKRKLEQNQMSNGAWSWFAGGRENRYITQHIITGFGHLSKLNVIDLSSRAQSRDLEPMIEKALDYLDAAFVKEYKDIKKYNAAVDLSKDHLSYTQLHYLYMRSFFPEIKKSKEVQDITAYYKTQIEKYWLSRSLYAKGMMALISERLDDKKTAKAILKSLKENSITSEELGMYWKGNTNSWYWYQAPIETQALLIEAFAEIDPDLHQDDNTIDNLKIWLLKNKQTNRWKTTKATTEAVYALLLQGSDWLSVTDMVDIVIGNQEIDPKKLEDVQVEAGTGYFKTSWKGEEIKPEMAEVKITKKGKGIAWGSLYWQYFEDLDKITTAETPLKLKKKLFLKKNTDLGEALTEVTIDTKLQIGDLVRVRIELRSDRAMEFVHMKDMRAAGLEPVNVLSQYKWQDGLGYYESTKDAATNFFFDYLPKGVFVFEYDLRVNNSGYMSNGITTIQSMYAPEFSSHSEGVKITVE